LLKILLTLTFVALIVWQAGGLGEISAAMQRMAPLYMVLVVMVMTLDRILMTYKWGLLLRLRGLHLPLWRGVQMYCAAMIWGMFLPATVGADAIRAVSASRMGLPLSEVTASIIIERMLGFMSALVLALCSLTLLSKLGVLEARFAPLWWIALALLIGALGAFSASFSHRTYQLIHERLLARFRESGVMARLRRFHETYRAYQEHKSGMTVFFGLSFAEQLLPILHSWLIAVGMGIDVGLLFIAGAVPLSLLIARIPISIDGLGVYDGAFILLMALAGVSPAESVAIAMIGRILQILTWLPWWAAYVMGRGSLRPETRPHSTE